MSRRILWTTVMMLGLVATGCVRFHGPEDMRRVLEEQAEVELDREMGITFTRSGMVLARFAARVSGDEDLPDLRGVRRLQVGVYRVEERGTEASGWLEPPLPEGWQTLARIREDGDQVIVQVKMDEQERIRRMLVVVAERDEWVLVRLKGKLDAFLDEALDLAFDEVDRPEMAERIRNDPDWPGDASGTVVAAHDAD